MNRVLIAAVALAVLSAVPVLAQDALAQAPTAIFGSSGADTPGLGAAHGSGGQALVFRTDWILTEPGVPVTFRPSSNDNTVPIDVRSPASVNPGAEIKSVVSNNPDVGTLTHVPGTDLVRFEPAPGVKEICDGFAFLPHSADKFTSPDACNGWAGGFEVVFEPGGPSDRSDVMVWISEDPDLHLIVGSEGGPTVGRVLSPYDDTVYYADYGKMALPGSGTLTDVRYYSFTDFFDRTMAWSDDAFYVTGRAYETEFLITRGGQTHLSAIIHPFPDGGDAVPRYFSDPDYDGVPNADLDGDGPMLADRCPLMHATLDSGGGAMTDADSNGCPDTVLEDDAATTTVNVPTDPVDVLATDQGANLRITNVSYDKNAGHVKFEEFPGTLVFTPAPGRTGTFDIAVEVRGDDNRKTYTSTLEVTVDAAPNPGSDDDGDTILNSEDKCPNTHATAGGAADSDGDGCPDGPVPVFIDDYKATTDDATPVMKNVMERNTGDLVIEDFALKSDKWTLSKFNATHVEFTPVDGEHGEFEFVLPIALADDSDTFSSTLTVTVAAGASGTERSAAAGPAGYRLDGGASGDEYGGSNPDGDVDELGDHVKDKDTDALGDNFDKDVDEVRDINDACPETPGIPSAIRAVNGCPDLDTDEVRDGNDACPNDNGVASTNPAVNGCPDLDTDGVPDVDPDGDGPMLADRCPSEAAGSRDTNGDGCTDARIVVPAHQTVAHDATAALDPLADASISALSVSEIRMHPDGAGTLSPALPSAGPFTFTPASGTEGPVRITFVIPDGPDRNMQSQTVVTVLSDPATAVDTDGDGMNDDVDRCDNTPDGSTVNEHGCIPPVAVSDAMTSTGGAVTINPLANDEGEDGSVISFHPLRGEFGTISLDGDTLTYTPDAGAEGTDEFRVFVLLSGKAVENTLTVTVAAPVGGSSGAGGDAEPERSPAEGPDAPAHDIQDPLSEDGGTAGHTSTLTVTVLAPDAQQRPPADRTFAIESEGGAEFLSDGDVVEGVFQEPQYDDVPRQGDEQPAGTPEAHASSIVTAPKSGTSTSDGSIPEPSQSSSSDEHLKAPTFGTSLLTHEQRVECGYSMDGVCRDVTEYHVEYEREVIETGSRHDFTLKAHGTDDIHWFQIGFGVPEIGSATEEAEALVHAEVSPDYASEAGYTVDRVEYRNDNNVIGEDAELDAYLDYCMAGDSERDCVTLEINGVLFREQMYAEPFVIFVMDENRRTATHYMNDGLLVQGDSLNPVPEHVYTEKSTSQQAAESIMLQRTDKLNDVWEDGAGHVFTRNDSGTWIMLESPAADMSSACTDEDSRACDAFADRLAEYNDSMEQLRDRLFAGVYETEEFDDLEEAVSIYDIDGDSRTAFLESSGMMWLRG